MKLAKLEKPDCDFCGAEPVLMRFESRSVPIIAFGLVPGEAAVLESPSAWYACSLCNDLIQIQDRSGLEQRALDGFAVQMNIDNELERNILLTVIQMMHASFFESRKGMG